MTIDRWINLLVTATLVEMMVAIGLGVEPAEVLAACKQWKLIARAAVANFVLVPAATVALLLVFHAKPMVAAGFMVLAACPGAPYGPPLTAIAKGNVAVSVGLMVLLACSSALVAPLLLSGLLPLVSSDAGEKIDTARLILTLGLTQLLPLFAGLGWRALRPALAARILTTATWLSKLLNLATVGVILVAQFRSLVEIRAAAFGGMLLLLSASLAAGWLLGGPTAADRRSLALTTSLRNVGASMVIAAGSFPGTAALTAVLAYGLVEILGSLALALWWRGR